MIADNLIKNIKQLSLMVEKERLSRFQVEMSPEYLALSDRIAELNQERSGLFSHIENSQSELSEARAEFVEYLRENPEYSNELVERKFKIKKEVNPNKVLTALGGDFGLFSELIKISQKDLKEFMTEDKDMQKRFKDCIDVISKELSDFVLK